MNGKDVGGSGHSPVSGTVIVFVWTDKREPIKF